MSAKVPGKGHTTKHTSSKKHHAKTSKHHPAHHHKAATSHGHGHHVHVVAKGAKHPVARGYAVGDLLPVCTFEAVAMSLRIAGQRADEDDLLELWWLAGAREVSIAEALDAASRFGLAGCRPEIDTATGDIYQRHAAAYATGLARVFPRGRTSQGNALILGVDRPGPHAVLATPDGWWSWGELYSPWPARIEEAWVVRWGDAA